MKQLRKGDTVTFKAVVTDVADWNNGTQQICAKLLPRGNDLGWCVPGEYDFEAADRKVRVGDKVMWEQMPHSDWKVVHINENWATLTREGTARPELARITSLVRKELS